LWWAPPDSHRIEGQGTHRGVHTEGIVKGNGEDLSIGEVNLKFAIQGKLFFGGVPGTNPSLPFKVNFFF
jgi:hypothetical protein